jgi:hypothetical protein
VVKRLLMIGVIAVGGMFLGAGRGASVPGQAISSSPFKFTNTPLLFTAGSAEPAITIGGDGTTVVSALDAGPTLNDFGTLIWRGSWTSTPTFQGAIDSDVEGGGRGGDDADVDLASTGTLHVTSLVVFFNPVTHVKQLGVAAFTCPNADTSANFAHCARQIIDTTGTDRPNVTSDGARTYIAYRDASNSSLIRIVRSDDDGYTWHQVGNPVVGQGSTTAASTFNNFPGPVVADPSTHDVFLVYIGGSQAAKKGQNFVFNNVWVARSTDLGRTWTTTLVFSGQADLFNRFPALAVDPTNGKLYATWSDGQAVSASVSRNHGVSWSAPFSVSAQPSKTAVFPFVAAYNGVADFVYYGTTGSGQNDPSAVWYPYMAQTKDDGSTLTQGVISDHSIRVGTLSRSLFADLFEIAINPQNGRAGVAYTDATLTTTASGEPQPQTVLARQR